MKRRLVQTLAIVSIVLCAAAAFGQQNTFQPPIIGQLPVWASELSASGRYIAELEYIPDRQQIIDEAERTDALPNISYRVGVWENNGSSIEQIAEEIFEAPLLTDAIALFDFAFSPDETLLAVREDGLVRLLRLPTLEIEQIIEAPAGQSLFYDELAWSSDSHYLAYNDAYLELSVWDRQTGAIHTSTSNQDFAGPITAVPQGWIVRLPWVPDGEERIFRACDLLVTNCDIYTLDDLGTTSPYEVASPAPNGQGVLVMMENDTAWWWGRSENGKFVASTDPVLSEIRGTIPDLPPFFSPDSRFIAIPNFYDVTKTDIYDVSSWEQVAPSLTTRLSNFIPDTDAIAWWESSKEALGITCLGQSSTIAAVELSGVSLVMEPFQVSAYGSYVLLSTDDGSDSIITYRVLFSLPEVDC